MPVPPAGRLSSRSPMAKMAGRPAPQIRPITQIFHRASRLIQAGRGGGQHDASRRGRRRGAVATCPVHSSLTLSGVTLVLRDSR